jgi:hypothetical protein
MDIKSDAVQQITRLAAVLEDCRNLDELLSSEPGALARDIQSLYRWLCGSLYPLVKEATGRLDRAGWTNEQRTRADALIQLRHHEAEAERIRARLG